MALRSRRDSAMIWPGFVDAVTTLLMVMMFILTIFTMMQVVLRDEINTQSDQLDSLTDQIAQLADALGLERQKAADLTAQVETLDASLVAAQAKGAEQASLIASLSGQLATAQGDLAAAQGRIGSFEAQVASLLAEKQTLTASVQELEDAQKKLLTEQEAAQLALAQARSEIDKQAEEARLAAARREAMAALVETLRKQSAEATAKLSDAEAARLVDAKALEELRERLKSSDDEIMAMTLALEEQRKKAEDTLTLLAAAQTEAAKRAEGLTGKDAALAAAKLALSEEQAKSLEAQRKMALLNEQIASLRGQLASLQAVLNEAAEKDAAAKVQLENLGSQLNAALAQVASEQRKRAELEEAERVRLQAENADLAKYRSEFFGKLSQLLDGREGVRVVGDRFVFSSEVLFRPGAADLAPEGEAQIAGVVKILNEIKDQIPEGIDWIIRVDGHTDNIPLSGNGLFRDNWELSQARALSVVRYMQTALGFPPERLAATGFGEYRPVASGNDEASRAMNRRIELKLTER